MLELELKFILENYLRTDFYKNILTRVFIFWEIARMFHTRVATQRRKKYQN